MSAPTLKDISPAVVDTAEAAKYLGVAPHSLEIWRSNRRYQIPYVKVGARVRYRISDLDAWLASRVVTA